MTRAELIEAMARAEARRHYAERFQKPADDPHVAMNVRSNWNIFAAQCDRSLSAIEQAGMVVVPKVPTEGMLNAAFDVYEINVIGSTFSTGRQVREAIYSSMIESGRLK